MSKKSRERFSREQSSLVPTRPSQQELPTQGISRRKALGWLGVLGGAGFLAYQFGVPLFGAKNPSPLPDSSVEMTPSPVRVPEMEIIPGPVEYSLPDEFKGEDQERILTNIRAAIPHIQDSIDRALRPALNKSLDVQSKRRLIRDFYSSLRDVLRRDPALDRYLQSSDLLKFEDIDMLAQRIRTLIVPVGYDLSLDLSAEGQPATGHFDLDPRLNWFQIESSHFIRISDGAKQYTVPVLIFGGPYLSEDNDFKGRFFPNLNAAVYLKPIAEEGGLNLIRKMQEYGLFPPGQEEELMRNFYEDTVNHEATHAYVAQRFPRYANASDPFQKYYIPFTEEIVPGVVVQLQQNCTPLVFNELMAVGSELAHSNSPIPISLYSYLCQGGRKLSGYELVNYLLPFITIQQAAASLEKDALLRAMASGQVLNTLRFAVFARKHLSAEQVKRVGQRLYQVGFDLMQGVEEGKYRKVAPSPAAFPG